MNKLVSSLIVLALSAPALALPVRVDEPSSFALLAIGAVAVAAMWRRRK